MKMKIKQKIAIIISVIMIIASIPMASITVSAADAKLTGSTYTKNNDIASYVTSFFNNVPVAAIQTGGMDNYTLLKDAKGNRITAKYSNISGTGTLFKGDPDWIDNNSSNSVFCKNRDGVYINCQGEQCYAYSNGFLSYLFGNNYDNAGGKDFFHYDVNYTPYNPSKCNIYNAHKIFSDYDKAHPQNKLHCGTIIRMEGNPGWRHSITLLNYTKDYISYTEANYRGNGLERNQIRVVYRQSWDSFAKKYDSEHQFYNIVYFEGYKYYYNRLRVHFNVNGGTINSSTYSKDAKGWITKKDGSEFCQYMTCGLYNASGLFDDTTFGLTKNNKQIRYWKVTNSNGSSWLVNSKGEPIYYTDTAGLSADLLYGEITKKDLKNHPSDYDVYVKAVW